MPDQDQALDETRQIEALVRLGGGRLQCRTACEIRCGQTLHPVYVVTLGNPDPACPAVGLFGGVHGLERIGAQVALGGLRNVVQRLRWDASLQHLLTRMRMVFMPVVNPGGMARGTRANPAGVDLMRNAPVDCERGAPPLLGGQRLSAGLPWYRGRAGEPMQAEAQALCEVVGSELLSHEFSIAVDCHSGFGLRDRLWFPHAHTARPIEHLPELQALHELLDEAMPHHCYLFEPQSLQYLTHGDLWDHLYLQALAAPDRVFLPLTLEMGSWLWVRKNPRQALSRHGLFNPQIAHRQQRVLRRHAALLDFMLRAAHSHRQWRPAAQGRETLRQRALDRWYRPAPSP